MKEENVSPEEGNVEQERTFCFDISKVELKDLEGNSYREDLEKDIGKPFHKDIGNGFYINSPDFDIMPKAQLIHAGEPVVFTESEAEVFKEFIKESIPYAPFIKQAILSQLVKD